MKRLHGLMFAILVTTMFSGPTDAAQPQDKIGSGKLLRQFRDDLFGKPHEKKPQPPAAQNQPRQPTPAQPQSRPGVNPKQPQPAGQHRSAQPPITQRSKQSFQQKPNQPQQQPSARQASQPNRNQANDSRTAGARNSNRNASPDPTRPSATNPAKFASHRIPAPAVNNSKSDVVANTEPKAVGMGMEIQVDKNDRFLVVQVDPRGNAAKAGVQRGDMVVKIGGSELKTKEELTEIIKVLGEGDQMEFQLSRKGQIKEVLIQFGEAPIVPAGQELIADSIPSPTAEFQQNSIGQPITGRYDFVPQPATEETRTDVGSQLSGARSIQASQFPQPIVDPNLSPSTNQLISQQRETLSELELELAPEAETNLPENAPPVEFGPSILELPELDGPGK